MARNQLGVCWSHRAPLVGSSLVRSLTPRPRAHLPSGSPAEMAIATCSPWGFPEMPRTSGSFMPDTVQGRARSLSSSCKRAPRGHVTAAQPGGGLRCRPSHGGRRGAPSAKVCASVQSHSVEASPVLPSGSLAWRLPWAPGSARSTHRGLKEGSPWEGPWRSDTLTPTLLRQK